MKAVKGYQSRGNSIMKPSTYITMEMQSGTKKLAEALELRGFAVKVEKQLISLRNGTERDIADLKRFLEVLNIPVFWNGDRFQLLINRFPFQKMKEIIHFSGKEHSVSMEGYHFQWRSFVTRRYGIRTNTIQLCPYTAIMVKALNEAGIVTLTGCNGHGNHSPNFRLSGVYNGIWFSIVQERYLKELPLYYKWEMEWIHNGTNAGIFAEKLPDEKWDMNKVLADCYQMAQVLAEHSEEIREWKQRTFKRNMKETAEALRLTRNVQQLASWMEGLAE